MATVSKIGDRSTVSKLDKRSDQYKEKSSADATKSAYASDWAVFTKWAMGLDLEVLPADSKTVRRYITHLADIGRKVSTIRRAMIAIRQHHKKNEFPIPTLSHDVLKTWQGIRREKGSKQNKAKALMLTSLKIVIDHTPNHTLGRRDAALILVGWAGALRRVEIVELDREHIEFVPEGMIITIARSKTDQEGDGYLLGIPLAADNCYCPTRMMKRWLEWSSIDSGPLFPRIGSAGRHDHRHFSNTKRLTPRMVNHIIKRRMDRAGLDSTGYSGHSMRAGFVTTAIESGAPEGLVQIHTRHKSVSTLRDYVRRGSLFTANPLGDLLCPKKPTPKC
jgi:site-specific recombinase XerD